MRQGSNVSEAAPSVIDAVPDHVGIAVDDLEQSLSWYVDTFGFGVLWRQEPHDVPGVALALPDYPVVRLAGAMLDAGQGRGIELHEFISPRGARQRAVNELGLNHLALAVPDIHEAIAALTEKGVHFGASPQLVSAGVLQGRQWIYGTDPFGVVLELCQHPSNPASNNRTETP